MAKENYCYREDLLTKYPNCTWNKYEFATLIKLGLLRGFKQNGTYLISEESFKRLQEHRMKELNVTSNA